MIPRRAQAVPPAAAIRAVSAASLLALAVATLLPLHSTQWSHEHHLAGSIGAVVTSQTDAHDTHRHPRTAGDPCEACVATAQARTAPVRPAGLRLEGAFAATVPAPVSAPRGLPAAPPPAQNHSRAPPSCA